MNFKHILISRTDSIGDVILTLPLAGLLRMRFPDARISFLGMPYTREIIESCRHIDSFVDWQTIKEQPEADSLRQFKELKADIILHVFPRKEIARLALKAGIPKRLGTTGRLYNWLYCNMLVPISRRNSDLHEAILNLKLTEKIHGFTVLEKVVGNKPDLKTSRFSDKLAIQKSHKKRSINDLPKSKDPFDKISIDSIPALFGFSAKPSKDITFEGLIRPEDLNVILHPRSKGSAREWGLSNYAQLARQLSSENNNAKEQKVRIFITGTRAEGDMLRKEGFFDMAGDVMDVTGKFSLAEFIQFIHCSDALIAGSTGPLHIAAALGKIALGLFPPIKPMHPGRWAPLGERAGFIVADKECSRCRKLGTCECMQLITIDQVQQKLETMVLHFNLKSNLDETHR